MKIIKYVALVSIFAIICTCFTGCFGKHSGADKIVKEFYSASGNNDVSAYINVFPGEFINKILSENFDGEKDKLITHLEELNRDAAKLELDYSITINSIEELTDGNITALKEELLKEYGVSTNLESASVVSATLTYTAKINGQQIENSSDETVTALNLGGKWFIHPKEFQLGL